MIKDIAAANEDAVPNDREMAVLREHFPACFKENGSFDLPRFKEYLSDKVTVTGEGYELRFLGKNYARLLVSQDTETVIVPDEDHNSLPQNAVSQNVYISGDNLDALKHLLKSYARKVKCIYIDPPYNTGSDGFVYNDSFKFTAEELSEKLSISEEQAQRIFDLTKTGKASHSAWLTFMYPRLLLARDLLTDDGVIFISIDDNEQANLKLLCDDVFGAENMLGPILWKKKTNGNNMGVIPSVHDYIVTYAKSINDIGELGYVITDNFIQKTYSNPDNDPRGAWTTMDLSANHEGPHFPIMNPVTGDVFDPPEGRYWVFNEDEVKRRIADKRIIFGKTGTARPVQKVFAAERMNGKTRAESWWDSHGMNEDATSEIKELLGNGKIFHHPKPSELLYHLVKITTCTDPNDIILDFFSGSGTAAHAVMQLNAEDGGSRKFIMVQLQEQVKAGSEAEKAGFATIDQIGIERIRRAAAKIKEANPLTTDGLDLGFQHFALAQPAGESLDKIVSFNPDKNELFASDLLAEFGTQTVLATWLARDGYGLTTPAQELDFAGYPAHCIGKHLYLMNKRLSNEAITAIAAKYETDGSFNPDNVVLFGYSFTWTELEALQVNLKRLQSTEKNLRINFDVRY